jgi:Xaa-Pro aminopeptidase
MRRDLDTLMKQRGIAGMVVFANDRYCPAMYYVTGRKFQRAIYFRAADGRAHLLVDAMERDDAAKTGIDHSTLSQHGWLQRLDRFGHAGGYADLMAEVMGTLGIKGRTAVYGDLDATYAWNLLHELIQRVPGIEIDRTQPDLISAARVTKEDSEIAAIRHASQAVVSAWRRLREHLSSLKREGDHFENGNGPVTLGSLRALLHTEFLKHGLEGGESIVAQGRDAGVPHNRGNDAELLRAGAPVIVDIFPAEAGGGYHSDFTRTFCMGRAPDALKALYDDTHTAFRAAIDHLKGGEPCRSYQERVCDVFEKRGHATIRSNQATEEGYVHSLGHGVGLDVHEAPRLGGPPANTQVLEPGMVVTIEPGLYYPSRGMGVRIEDLVVITPDGRYENLTPAPYDLEIQVGA